MRKSIFSFAFVVIAAALLAPTVSNGESVAPRDPATGLPTGKRMHKPSVSTKQNDKSTPKVSNGSLLRDNNHDRKGGRY
jgi:hypothetical protein